MNDRPSLIGAITLHVSNRPAPLLIAYDPALDFLNSICTPAGEEFEWLQDGQDLLDWLTKSGQIDDTIAASYHCQFGPGELNRTAGRARELREWFRTFVVAHAGSTAMATALTELKRLNTLLATDEFYRQIDHSGTELIWTEFRRFRGADDLLLSVAEMFGDLVCSVGLFHVKNCEGPSCTLWFNDISKNHTRRWCSMSVCGNRAKAAAYRARRKQKGAS